MKQLQLMLTPRMLTRRSRVLRVRRPRVKAFFDYFRDVSFSPAWSFGTTRMEPHRVVFLQRRCYKDAAYGNRDV
jgi:hypothetical protein